MPRRLTSQEKCWGFSHLFTVSCHFLLSLTSVSLLVLWMCLAISFSIQHTFFKWYWLTFFLFVFNSFWFTCPIEFTLAVHTEVCSWMICKACSWIYLPFLLVYCPQALCGFTVYVLLRIWHQMSSSTAIFQAVSFSRTFWFRMIISWMFGLLVSRFSSGYLVLFLLPHLQVPLSLYYKTIRRLCP